VGLGGGRKLEADRHSQYQVALEAVGIGIAPAQRVANEPHALREPRVLERPSQFARQEVGDLVLEAFASAVGEWEVVRLLADAQHPVAAYRLALLRRCAERQQQSRRYDECPAPRAPRSARVEADKVFGGLSGHLVRAGSPRAPCVFARSIPLTLRKVAAVKFASARLAPVKSVSMKFEPLKSAPARLAPRISVPLNSAPFSLAPARLAPERSEKLKSAREKSDPERSAPLRLAERMFARMSPIDWFFMRSEEHTSELQSRSDLVCRLLLEKKKPVY